MTLLLVGSMLFCFPVAIYRNRLILTSLFYFGILT